jgi:hypothetical protein
MLCIEACWVPHMLEVELGLLSYGGIRVERRLDAIPQHVDIHGRSGSRAWGGLAVCEMSLEKDCRVGALEG